MDKVRIEKQKLMNVLTDNFDKHLTDLKDIKHERRGEILDHCRDLIENIRKDKEYQPVFKQYPLPDDHSDEYRRAIKMVEFSVDENIELSERQFDELVMDNWNWKRGFELAKSAYLGH